MEKVMVVPLIVTLLIGVSQEQELLPPGPIYKQVGENVLFTTIASSQTITAIRWHFNGTVEIVNKQPGSSEVVNPTYRGRVSLNTSSGELELKGVTMADSGEYSLTLTYNTGIGHKDSTFLEVFEPVFSLGIISPEGDLIEHSRANFSCEGNGSIITRVWMKEGVILSPSSNIMFLDENKTMVINPMKRSDHGDYQCVISNPVSSSTASYSITVNYGPDVKILGSQTLEEGSDILLYCSPDSVPPATVTWTVKGMFAGNAPLYVTENSKPSDSGEYNCTCYNNVTRITSFAAQVVTVRVVSPRLSPGVEAGITLGVIIAVAIAVGLICFFVKRSKKPADVEKKEIRMVNQQTDQTSNDIYMEADAPTQVSTDRTGQHMYINSKPSPPSTARPRLPPKSVTNLF